jgi:hypothetical protein
MIHIESGSGTCWSWTLSTQKVWILRMSDPRITVLIGVILHQDRPDRRLQTVSVNPVERRPVELEHAIPGQPQVALAIRVDTHDLLARQPVFGRVVPQ